MIPPRLPPASLVVRRYELGLGLLAERVPTVMALGKRAEVWQF